MNYFDEGLIYNGQYGIEAEYDRTNCTGRCNSYCRCSRIVNPKVVNVDPAYISRSILADSSKDNSILRYAIERALIEESIYDPDCWSFDISNGYYGEELNGMTFDNVRSLNKSLSALYCLTTDSEIIRFALELEYGFVLDSVKDLIFTIEEVDRSLIKIPNEVYHHKLTDKSFEMYKGYVGPIGVVRECGGKLMLIDGYHRFSSSKGMSNVEVIIGRA